MIDSEQIELARELNEYKNEKEIFDTTLKNEQIRLANMLKGEMGKDIQDVLSGKTKVKLSWSKRCYYKIKNFFIRLFNII